MQLIRRAPPPDNADLTNALSDTFVSSRGSRPPYVLFIDKGE